MYVFPTKMYIKNFWESPDSTLLFFFSQINLLENRSTRTSPSLDYTSIVLCDDPCKYTRILGVFYVLPIQSTPDRKAGRPDFFTLSLFWSRHFCEKRLFVYFGNVLEAICFSGLSLPAAYKVSLVAPLSASHSPPLLLVIMPKQSKPKGKAPLLLKTSQFLTSPYSFHPTSAFTFTCSSCCSYP